MDAIDRIGRILHPMIKLVIQLVNVTRFKHNLLAIHPELELACGHNGNMNTMGIFQDNQVITKQFPFRFKKIYLRE